MNVGELSVGVGAENSTFWHPWCEALWLPGLSSRCGSLSSLADGRVNDQPHVGGDDYGDAYCFRKFGNSNGIIVRYKRITVQCTLYLRYLSWSLPSGKE